MKGSLTTKNTASWFSHIFNHWSSDILDWKIREIIQDVPVGGTGQNNSYIFRIFVLAFAAASVFLMSSIYSPRKPFHLAGTEASIACSFGLGRLGNQVKIRLHVRFCIETLHCVLVMFQLVLGLKNTLKCMILVPCDFIGLGRVLECDFSWQNQTRKWNF